MKKIYRNYILQVLLVVILFLTFIYLNESIKIFLAIFMIIFATITCFFIKKNRITSIKSRQVTLVMFCMAVIELTLYYLLGLYFGYVKSNVKLSIWSIAHFILPISSIIISSEIIRYRFTMQQTKISKLLSIISMILIDMIVYTQLYDIKVLTDFLAITGFILFASISSNLLYEYISPKYGYTPVIVYRLVIGIYSYIIPILPDVYIFTRSVLRMICPFIIYLILEYVFSKKIKGTELKKARRSYYFITIIIIISILLTMLISCKFYYGIIVVGSESMTGTIDKGDVVIFTQYKGQEINEEDVIVFRKDNRQIIHRVVNSIKVGQEYRYYTKGDANPNIDNGYVEKRDIVGVCRKRIKHIGYPTIWIKEAFDKNNEREV